MVQLALDGPLIKPFEVDMGLVENASPQVSSRRCACICSIFSGESYLKKSPIEPISSPNCYAWPSSLPILNFNPP